jgi:nitrite reductase (NAD(P)H)
MFGAAKEDLPQIWEELCDAGFESGHAYGKALRTVKSCVGSTWCRYGIGDSVGFAVELESRYKGIRAPHKIKGGVSGCVRECAEAQSKDFGLIATLKGWNIFVGGNGGAKPRHAELLATDIPKKKAIRIIDRFLMLYIQSADKLQRTARWVESLSQNGTTGLEYLRKVIIEDSLGICADLDRAMDELVGSYFDEWAAVVKDPKKRALFKQFANTNETQPEALVVLERGQLRPVDPPENLRPSYLSTTVLRAQGTWEWRKITSVDVLGSPSTLRTGSTSAVIRYSDVQIAIFKLVNGRVYATQHACPHRRAFVLAEGVIGDTAEGIPYVSCPLHKRNFTLTTGECLNDEDYRIMVFDVKEEDGHIYINLPEPIVLDQHLGTSTWLITAPPDRSEIAAGVEISLDVEPEQVHDQVPATPTGPRVFDSSQIAIGPDGTETVGSTSGRSIKAHIGMATTVDANQSDSCPSGTCGSSQCGGKSDRNAVDW